MSTPASGSTTTLSGVLEVPTAPGGIAGGLANFGTWRGKAVQSVTAYIGTSSWASMTGIAAQAQTSYFAGTGVHVSWSIPLIPTDGSDTLENAATGADNAKYKSMAEQLIAGGDAYSTIRLGWEAGGSWFNWSGASDPAAYVGAFQQAVTSMRSAAGAHFTFDWNYALHTNDPTQLYPGDAYVDYIGADIYDKSYAWSFPASDHAAVWNEQLTEQWGINWLYNFATTHGKAFSIPEWGETYLCNGHGGGDDPLFIQNMHDWIASRNVAYEDYANGDNSSCEKYALSSGTTTLGTFPQAAALYKSLFGPSSTTTSTAPPAAADSSAVTWMDHSPIRLSWSPDRSNDAQLNGMTLTGGAAYVFVNPPASIGTTKVEFFLDLKPGADPFNTTPWVTELSPPFDLGGTAMNLNSQPVYPSQLATGSHTLMVFMIDANGNVTASNAFFTTTG